MTVLTAAPVPPGDPDVALLVAGVERLLAGRAVDLPPAVSLERLRTVLVQRERLDAVLLDAVRDLEARELFALDGAGSARSWLMAQRVGGDPALVSIARRQAERPVVRAAHRDGRLATRAAQQVCTALEGLPVEADEATMTAVLDEAVSQVLNASNGGSPPDAVAVEALLTACKADTLAAPAARLEPVFVLLATRLAPTMLAAALSSLTDALAPEAQLDQAEDVRDQRNLTLNPVQDGAWDVRGLLDPETGILFHTELERRMALDPDQPGQVRTKGQRRADALAQLLRDVSGVEAGTGGGSPAHLTVFAWHDSVLARPGSLPGTFADGTPMPAPTLQRLGCDSILSAVTLDAAGRPVGASTTLRSATRRERQALRAQWGTTCAADGCDREGVIPHHVIPWWLAKRSRLRDLMPLCSCHHHDLHEGERTLRLRDGRSIHPEGWVDGQ